MGTGMAITVLTQARGISAQLEDHGNLYYGRFEEPPLGKRFSVEWGGIRGIPDGWRDRKPEEVKAAIAKLCGGVDADSLEEESKRVREALETFQNELISHRVFGLQLQRGDKTRESTVRSIANIRFCGVVAGASEVTNARDPHPRQ